MARRTPSANPKPKRPSARAERAARAHRRRMMRRVVWIATGFLAALTALGGVWAWKTEVAPKAMEALAESLFGLTADMGLEVRQVLLQGRSRTALKDISEATAVPMGSPTLAVSVTEMRERLERLDWVKTAVVERQWPDTIVITLTERTPVALWQQRGVLRPIDDEGHPLPAADARTMSGLPVLVGEDAPENAHALLSMLASHPDLSRRVTSAVRIGGRRWNLNFDTGLEVKLPEENPQTAWEGLAEMVARDNLLERGVHGVDMRLPDRMYLRLPKETMQQLRGEKKT